MSYIAYKTMNKLLKRSKRIRKLTALLRPSSRIMNSIKMGGQKELKGKWGGHGKPGGGIMISYVVCTLLNEYVTFE